MSLPSFLKLTPSSPTTVGIGASTDASSEFWQLVAGSTFVVYENVPYAVMQQILQQAIPDTVIASQLAAYPKRTQHV